MATFDSSGSVCTDAGSWLHPPRPAPPPWWIAPNTMTDGPRSPSLGWMRASISLSPRLWRTANRPSLWFRENRDSSLKIQCFHCLRSHTQCLLPHSRRRRLCSKVSLGPLAGRRDQYLAARSRLRMVRADILLPNRWIICIRRQGAVISDYSEQLMVFPWRGDFHRTSTLPLMWSASLSVASQNFAYASLRHPQHPGYFSLRIAICGQPDNSLQYLLWQILWHDPLSKFKEISIVFNEAPRCIKASKW